MTDPRTPGVGITTVSERTYAQRLLGKAGGARFPYAALWELTYRCNLKCVMCYTDPANTPERIRQELSCAEIIRILDELHEAGCVELTFTGGEPLARPDFMRIYDEAHRQGFLLTIFTNGTLITTRIADRWAVAGPKSVEISLHAVSAAPFDGVTQVSGSFQSCLRGIELLMARKIPLVLKTVGLTVNREQILAVKRYVDALGPGVTWRFGQYMRDDLVESGSPYRFQLSEEDLMAIERQDPQLWEAKRDEIRKSESVVETCGAGRSQFHIDACGQLQLCSNNRTRSYDLRHGSFREGFYEALPTFPCPRRDGLAELHIGPQIATGTAGA